MDFINAIILLLNYIFVPALTYGSQLALGAIFVTLIYGILRFANFATGDMMAFGTMVTILFTWYFQSLGISLGVLPTALLAIPFAIIFMIGYMLFIDKFVFRYYRVNKSPPVQLAMVSIGVMFVTQAVVRIIIGPSDRRFFDGEKFIIKVKRTNVAILMVEQNAKQALNISDRGYVLVTGENKYSGTGKELLNDSRVRSSFLGG